MSNAEFGWESLLDTSAPPECSLKAALFTTYDRADERLLVEHLLPLLLKLGREPDGEGTERQYFLLELDRRLKQLHDQLVVVSSTVREEPGDSEEGQIESYGWIWGSIRHLTVGSRRKAVQHAKFWLLHWGAADTGGVEYIELVVSSANLTSAAFKVQMQAAWRARIELRSQRSASRLARWGVLPAFLQELAASAGDDGRLAPFVELLARADCPEGVTFVASVPGSHSRQTLRRTPWGAAGLGTIAPLGRGAVRVSILSPFIGSWSPASLSRWCAEFKSSPDCLELVWIDKNHPWARDKRWLLPETTLKTLTGARAILLHLRNEPNDYSGTDRFHEQHRPTDPRWSHAKVYLFKRGTSRRLLVTSANFSTSAWGSEGLHGELTIENFELGVCIEQAAWPFEDLDVFEDEENAATVAELPRRGAALITWARAVWNGKLVAIDCRCDAKHELLGEIDSAGAWTPITAWTKGADASLCSARVPWPDSKRSPSFVRLTCDDETLNVVVFDERPSREREDSVPPEVDENVVQTMRDELLFEQYGGRIAGDVDDEPATDQADESEDGHESTDHDQTPEDARLRNVKAGDAAEGSGTEEENEVGIAERTDSYAIPAFVLARQHLHVVDNWAERVKLAANHATEEFERQVLRRDGELLIEAFQRQAGRDEKKGMARAFGAKLAAEELIIRLMHFPEV